MKKEELNRLAITVAELMAERPGSSILTETARKCLDKGTHMNYLKMMWEQANQASKQVKAILGEELFEQVKNLDESDLKDYKA